MTLLALTEYGKCLVKLIQLLYLNEKAVKKVFV